MAMSLAERIREAAKGADTEASEVLSLVRNHGREQRRSAAWDELLGGVVRNYRRGPKQMWAPVLLEALAPAMTCELARLRPLQPAIGSEDLSQQMVMEVLAAAALIPLPAGARFVDRRIMLRARNRLSRWLKHEARQEASRIYVNTIP